jgi:hypothetical protein
LERFATGASNQSVVAADVIQMFFEDNKNRENVLSVLSALATRTLRASKLPF